MPQLDRLSTHDTIAFVKEVRVDLDDMKARLMGLPAHPEVDRSIRVMSMLDRMLGTYERPGSIGIPREDLGFITANLAEAQRTYGKQALANGISPVQKNLMTRAQTEAHVADMTAFIDASRKQAAATPLTVLNDRVLQRIETRLSALQEAIAKQTPRLQQTRSDSLLEQDIATRHMLMREDIDADLAFLKNSRPPQVIPPASAQQLVGTYRSQMQRFGWQLDGLPNYEFARPISTPCAPACERWRPNCATG